MFTLERNAHLSWLLLMDRCWILDARYWIFWITQIVRSKNIQYPEASIQYLPGLARLFDSTDLINCIILCNYEVLLANTTETKS